MCLRPYLFPIISMASGLGRALLNGRLLSSRCANSSFLFPASSYRRVSTTSLPFEPLPDPSNPHENPLATVGDEELSAGQKYWRKRQSETPRPVYVRDVTPEGFAVAVGKRKSSSARIWLRNGTGEVTVNDRHWVDYFPRVDHRAEILRPLFLLGKAGSMDVKCVVSGGGCTGQAEAMRHGIARAMLKWNPGWRTPLKKDGLLTRDSRVVESKKYGRKKARKSPTWVKR